MIHRVPAHRPNVPAHRPNVSKRWEGRSIAPAGLPPLSPTPAAVAHRGGQHLDGAGYSIPWAALRATLIGMA